jgi:hypothetical protein
MGKGAQKNPGSIKEAIAQGSISSSAKIGLGAHSATDPSVARRAAPAMAPVPGMEGAPHKGLTAPGVVDQIVEVVKAAGGLSDAGAIVPRGYIQTSVLKRGK